MAQRTAKQRAATADADKNELIQLEKAFWEAMNGSDGLVGRLTEGGCIVIGPRGAGEVDAAKNAGDAPYEMERGGLDENSVQVRMVGDGVAVVAYEVDQQLTFDGQSTRIKAYGSSVWVKRRDRWVCAMRAETIADGRDPATGRRRAN